MAVAQTEALIETLKQALKQHRVTYAQVARALAMSEANVKRMFATRRLTLDRLEAVCHVLGMELSDLFHLYEQSRHQITHLSLEQEEELVKDISLLLVAVSVRNRLSYDDIINNYRISPMECIRCLAALDRLKVIDLLPNNRIKLRIDEDFRWLPGGPIERFFETQVLSHFLKSGFHGKLEERLFVFGVLSEGSVQHLLNRIQTFASEFTELHRQDSSLPLHSRRTVGLLLAMRPWEADVFRPYLKKPGHGNDA